MPSPGRTDPQIVKALPPTGMTVALHLFGSEILGPVECPSAQAWDDFRAMRTMAVRMVANVLPTGLQDGFKD